MATEILGAALAEVLGQASFDISGNAGIERIIGAENYVYLPIHYPASMQCPANRYPKGLNNYRRRPFLPLARGSSKRTFKGLSPPTVLPSSPAIAALASCPSISIKPKPLHLPVKTSETRLMERMVPYSENNARTVSSVASKGKFPTNIFFKACFLA